MSIKLKQNVPWYLDWEGSEWPGMVTLNSNPSTQEAESGRQSQICRQLQVLIQPQVIYGELVSATKAVNEGIIFPLSSPPPCFMQGFWYRADICPTIPPLHPRYPVDLLHVASYVPHSPSQKILGFSSFLKYSSGVTKWKFFLLI